MSYRIVMITSAPEGAVAHLSQAVLGRPVSEALLLDTAYGWGTGNTLPRRMNKRAAARTVKNLKRFHDTARGYYTSRGMTCFNVFFEVVAA